MPGGVEGLLESLHARAAERLRTAYAPKSSGPVRSSLAALARFADACPDRELFRRPRFAGDLEVEAYNEWTLVLFCYWLVSEPSPSTSRPLRAKSARSYVSLITGYLEHEYSFPVVSKPKRLKRLLAAVEADEPLGGVRRKRRGFRRRHLRKLWKLEWTRRTDTETLNKVAAIATAWHTLARGGELCPSASHSQWRADLHPTRADLAFRTRPNGLRYAVLWLRPLKKKGAAAQPKIPQYIAEHDGSGSDVYMLLKRLVALDPVQECAKARTPLFRQLVRVGDQWERRHMTVAQLRKTTRSMAALLGYTTSSEWGAHSARIGGATDLAATGKASELVLKAKGRWASDIGAIYARMTARSLLAASQLMQKARGRDLEELMPDFVQPA